MESVEAKNNQYASFLLMSGFLPLATIVMSDDELELITAACGKSDPYANAKHR
jgi:hypothetical protein